MKPEEFQKINYENERQYRAALAEEVLPAMLARVNSLESQVSDLETRVSDLETAAGSS